MREIIFRGKRVDNGTWAYGDLTHCDDEMEINSESHGENGGYIIPDTIGQYTGLTDKNGTRLFEGDILHIKCCDKTGSRICLVYFGEYIDADSVFDNYRCIGFYLKTSDGCCTIGALLSEEFGFEIIGNIHDDPELLEGD